MRIGLINIGLIDEFLANDTLGKVDVLLLSFLNHEVCYETELDGKSHIFEKIALLSKIKECVTICGAITNTCGHRRKSAIIAQEGKLLGVADMLNVIDGNIGSGGMIKVYETKCGRLGVAVADDLRFPDFLKTLSLSGSDCIFCPFENGVENIDFLVRAGAYYFGVPIAFCGKGLSMVVNSAGDVVCKTQQKISVTDLEIKKEYHLIEYRQRMSVKNK